MRKTIYQSSLLKVVVRGCEVLKRHQLKSKRNIFLHGLWRTFLFMQSLECLFLCKALISRRLTIGGKASLKSITYPFLQVYHKKHCGLLLSDRNTC